MKYFFFHIVKIIYPQQYIHMEMNYSGIQTIFNSIFKPLVYTHIFFYHFFLQKLLNSKKGVKRDDLWSFFSLVALFLKISPQESSLPSSFCNTHTLSTDSTPKDAYKHRMCDAAKNTPLGTWRDSISRVSENTPRWGWANEKNETTRWPIYSR